MKFDRLGWIVAAALAGGIAGMGFQNTTEKTGTVDMAKVFNDSDYAKKQTDSLRTMGQARQGVLEFIRQNEHLKPEDATKFHDLSIKADPTANDKADIERIKKDAITVEMRFSTLSTKDKPTQAEVTELEDLNRRKEAVEAMLGKWGQDFSTELQTKQEGLRNDTLEKVKDAVAQVAKQQGYTMVFVQDVAPYSANDLTPDALKVMNKK